ncbi:MAG: hypothetical protein Q8Q31_05645 [Nanoarchaeota archaeon]|nr:hypothetical protein [Nanoarchaeota archaeon]
MKKSFLKKFIGEHWSPRKYSRLSRPLLKRVKEFGSIVEEKIIDSEHRSLPYTISKKVFRHLRPNLISYESSLNGMQIPFYRGYPNYVVRALANDLIFSACGIGMNNPESSRIVVSIDNIPTDEPLHFEVFYQVKKRHQFPRIRGEDQEAVSELVVKTEKIYDFFLHHREGFNKALEAIDHVYPRTLEEHRTMKNYMVAECGLHFVQLQSRPRVGITSPERERQIRENLRVEGFYL